MQAYWDFMADAPTGYGVGIKSLHRRCITRTAQLYKEYIIGWMAQEQRLEQLMGIYESLNQLVLSITGKEHNMRETTFEFFNQRNRFTRKILHPKGNARALF